MAVEDVVIARSFVDLAPGLNSGAQVLLGAVNAESGGPPITDAQVIWENGELSTVPIAQLSKVFQPDDFGASHVGKWVQLKAFPAAGVGAPKNPAASGVVIAAFQTGPYDAADPTLPAFLVIALGDSGRRLVVQLTAEGDEANSPIVVQQGRRRV